MFHYIIITSFSPEGASGLRSFEEPSRVIEFVIAVGSAVGCFKMDIKRKEGQGLNISIKVDFKRYKRLIEDIKQLGKGYEHSSNPNRLNYSLLANFQKLPYMKVKGWCSRVVDKNGKVSEVFFADYDNILYRIVQDEIRYLMEEYDMPPFYVFTTFEDKDCNKEVYGNYIIICLKKQTFRKVIEMQKELHCDQAYKQIPLIYRFKTWVLRLGNKGKKNAPKFKEVIGNLNKTYNQEVSNAHLQALQGIYEIPKVKYSNKDKNPISKLFVTEYVTASK